MVGVVNAGLMVVSIVVVIVLYNVRVVSDLGRRYFLSTTAYSRLMSLSNRQFTPDFRKIAPVSLWPHA